MYGGTWRSLYDPLTTLDARIGSVGLSKGGQHNQSAKEVAKTYDRQAPINIDSIQPNLNILPRTWISAQQQSPPAGD